MNIRVVAGAGVVIAAAIIVVATVASAAPGFHQAPRANTPLGTGFTYQGYLEDAGGAVTGQCDFTFDLFDQSAGGTQLGATDTSNAGVAVTGGLFTTVVNAAGEFGASAFDGNQRWLAVAARCPAGAGVFTPLVDRQAITPTPYAVFSMDSAKLGGVPASQYTRYSRTVLVSPGATDVESGTRLVAALAGITDASAAKPYLVKLEPGIYQVSSSLATKPFVDIEGSGRDVTFVDRGVNGGTTLTLGTDVEIRDLTLRASSTSQGTPATAVTMAASNGTARLRNVHTVSVGGKAEAIFKLSGTAVLEVVDCVLEGSIQTAGSFSTLVQVSAGGIVIRNSRLMLASIPSALAFQGVLIGSGVQAEIVNTSISLSGGGGQDGLQLNSPGVYRNLHIQIVATSAAATPRAILAFAPVEVESSSLTVSGAGVAIGIRGQGTYRNTTVRVTGTTNVTGVEHDSSSPMTIADSDVKASGGTTNIGVEYKPSSGTPLLAIDRSRVEGSTNTVKETNSGTIRVGASQLAGGPIANLGAAMVCINVYDENHAALAPGCTG